MINILVAFEFINNKPANYTICHAGDGAEFINPPERPIRGAKNDGHYRYYTHLYEMEQMELDEVWRNRDSYYLDVDGSLTNGNIRFNVITIYEITDHWTNYFVVDEAGEVYECIALFNDEMPSANMISKPVPLNLSNPIWSFELNDWVAGEPFKRPKSVDELVQENDDLKAQVRAMAEGVLSVLDFIQ